MRKHDKQGDFHTNPCHRGDPSGSESYLQASTPPCHAVMLSLALAISVSVTHSRHRVCTLHVSHGIEPWSTVPLPYVGEEEP